MVRKVRKAVRWNSPAIMLGRTGGNASDVSGFSTVNAMDDFMLDRVRRVCLSLPESTEKLAWGEPTFRVKGKLFAMYADANNHHGAGRYALWCPAPEGTQAVLVEVAPNRFFVPPYVGKRGWIGMWLDQIDDDELIVHVRTAYSVVAPKRLQTRLDAPTSERDT